MQVFIGLWSWIFEKISVLGYNAINCVGQYRGQYYLLYVWGKIVMLFLEQQSLPNCTSSQGLNCVSRYVLSKTTLPLARPSNSLNNFISSYNQWGSICARWHYWSRMLAFWVLNLQKKLSRIFHLWCKFCILRFVYGGWRSIDPTTPVQY